VAELHHFLEYDGAHGLHLAYRRHHHHACTEVSVRLPQLEEATYIGRCHWRYGVRRAQETRKAY
jgi:hypothetical protein